MKRSKVFEKRSFRTGGQGGSRGGERRFPFEGVNRWFTPKSYLLHARTEKDAAVTRGEGKENQMSTDAEKGVRGTRMSSLGKRNCCHHRGGGRFEQKSKENVDIRQMKPE